MAKSVARRAVRRANQLKASPRELKALLEAGIVESGLEHDKYAKPGSGDRDSVGFLQQRPSQGWGPAGESVERDTEQFLRAAMKLNRAGFKGSAGQLAQAVQRSAYPGRYDERSSEADRLLRELTGRDQGRSAPNGVNHNASRTRTTHETIPGEDRSEERRALLASYITQERGRPGALLALKAGLDQTPDIASETIAHTQRIPGQPTRTARKTGDGPRGASGEIKEMFYNGAGGINVDNGKRVGKGFVDGHTDHVHIAAGPKRIRDIARMAQDMGLTVSELDGFDKVDPVHAPNSFHYSKRAADISGDPKLMAELTRRIARRFNL